MADSATATAESPSLVGDKRRSSSTDLEGPNKRHKSDSPVVGKGSFTDQFFIDMAATIARSFPVREFAKAHCCSRRDVLDALSAVVLSPLREPQSWHSAESVSEYAQILIGDWTGRREGFAAGTPSRPIIISDTSPCSSPVESTNPSASDDSLDSQNSVTPPPKAESASEKRPSPSVSAEDIITSKESPDVKEEKTPGDEKSVRSSREPKASRKEVRLDAYGTCVPVDKWIDGYHIPAPPKIRSDALSDVEFFKMLAEGWFD